MPISILAVIDVFTRDQIHTCMDESLTSSEFERDTPWIERYLSGSVMKRNTLTVDHTTVYDD